MSFYNKSTNFAVKDSLTTGDPNKIVSGVEIDTEFTNIASGFSGVDSSISSLTSDKSNKANNPTEDNIATLTTDGSIQDSGQAIADLYGTDDLKTDLNATGTAPIYAARAWLIRRFSDGVTFSKNIDSVTSGGAGVAIVNFSTPMEDANYAIVTGVFGDDEIITIHPNTLETDKFEMRTRDISSGLQTKEFCLAVFR